ncbi:MAG TPA: hypothetical protein VHL09_09305 [Dehalococcoidia bacterium]|nr:hypothetical protein [Dehalococcoidia bacterium]
MTPRIVPPPRPDAPTPGQRLAGYRRIALIVPAAGDLGTVLDRAVRLLPERCPWLLAAAGYRLAPGDRLTLEAATDPAIFPGDSVIGQPVAGWAAARGDPLIVVDRPAFRGPGPEGGSVAAAPIVRLNGAVVGALEVVAGAPWDLLDGDAQGLRQLGQALARLAPVDHPERRPPAATRNAMRPLVEAYRAAVRDFAARLTLLPELSTPDSDWTGREIRLRLTCREAEAVSALTECLAGVWEDIPDDAGERNAAGLARQAGLSRQQVEALSTQVHRELRRTLALCTDEELAREPRIGAWVEALTRHYRDH